MSLAKRLLFVALGAFVWLLAPSALAAAPRCDVRAATTLAPAPTLEDPSSSVDLGDACTPSTPLDVVHEGHGASDFTFSATPDLSLSNGAAVMPAPRSSILSPKRDTEGAPSGVRSSVDRPPRS